MHESKATLSYSFGEIKAKVGIDGKIDRPTQLADHVLSTLVTMSGIEVVQYGISEQQREEDSLYQHCVSNVEFGEISLTVELEFSLKQHMSKRTLNTIVFSGILPKVWETVGLYLGDSQMMTNPAAPLAQRSHREVLHSIDSALLGTAPSTFETDGALSSDPSRQRQYATSAH
jgi:hypothetical protein